MMQLGLQLYTLRDYLQTDEDIEKNLKRVADIGYKTVQVSGLGPIDPKKLRKICDDNNLKIVITHNKAERFLNDIDNLIEDNKILGCKYVGIGGLPGKYRNPEHAREFGVDFKEAVTKIKAAGMQFTYHNHSFEFQKFNGKHLLEYILECFTPEEMNVTLDTYWVQYAGGDVLQWIDILKDRLGCVHLKDMQVIEKTPCMAPILEGNMNFKGILNKLEDLGCTEHILVEQDNCLNDPFEDSATSYKNLCTLGYR